MTGFVTTEMFGVPVDFKITQTMAGDVCTIKVEGWMPKVELDKSGDFLRIWAPPRMERPVSIRDLNAMALFGLF